MVSSILDAPRFGLKYFSAGGHSRKALSELLRTLGQEEIAAKRPPFTQSLPVQLGIAEGTLES